MKALRTPISAPRTLGVALGLLGAVSVACAQGSVEQKLVQRYGGALAPECGNYLLPQLLYLGDSLVVRNGGKPVLTGRNVRAAPTYFGATPPPEFETALTGEVAGGGKLVFVFYRNASGLFAAVEGAPDVVAAVPGALKGKRIPHCDANRNVAPGAKPPQIAMTDSFARQTVESLGRRGYIWRAARLTRRAIAPATVPIKGRIRPCRANCGSVWWRFLW